MSLATVRAALTYAATVIANAETDLFTVTLPPVTPTGKFTLLFAGVLGSLTNYTVQAYVLDENNAGARHLIYTSGAKTADANVAVVIDAPGCKQVVVTVKSTGTITGSTLAASARVQVPS